jgi:hypothetical protein
MRLLSVLLPALLLLTTAAHAQSKAPASAPTTASNVQLSQTAGATREVLQALLFDIGIFDGVTEAQMPGLRNSIRGLPQYTNGDSQRRLALDQFIEAMPDVIRAEVTAEMDIMAANIAPHIVQTMRPDEIRAFATFFRSTELRPLVNRMIGEGVNSGAENIRTEPTPEEQVRISAFMATPDGQAVATHSEAFWQAVGDEIRAAAPRMYQRLQGRLFTDLCASLGDECPLELRQRASPS